MPCQENILDVPKVNDSFCCLCELAYIFEIHDEERHQHLDSFTTMLLFWLTFYATKTWKRSLPELDSMFLTVPESMAASR